MPNFTHMKVQVVGKLAAEALRREAAATPKPGLVDKENSGAHRDMDYPLFLASAKALEAYFTECAQIGAEAGAICATWGSGGSPEDSPCKSEILQTLRTAGLSGEAAMFAATGGVNTHKGLVFSMGILCFCLGKMTEESGVSMKEIDRMALQKQCAAVAAVLLGELDPADTNGGKVYREQGVGGIRKEALSGFAGAFEVGLPALEEAAAKGFAQNEAMIYALLSLMAVTEDSNTVHRGGKEGLAFMKRRAAELLERANLSTETGMNMVRDFDRECIRRNLSPGGCADLLAFSAMLFMIFNGEEL